MGAKVPVKALSLGFGTWVAHVGARDERPDPSQRLLVGDELQEQLSQRVGGLVMSAPQRQLGLGVEQRSLGGEMAFVVVGVQQAGRRPAVDGGGQLPREVDAVDHAGVEGDAARRDTGGLRRRPTRSARRGTLGLPSVKAEARHPARLGEGRSTPSTRRMLWRSSVTVIGSSSS